MHKNNFSNSVLKPSCQAKTKTANVNTKKYLKCDVLIQFCVLSSPFSYHIESSTLYFIKLDYQRRIKIEIERACVLAELRETNAMQGEIPFEVIAIQIALLRPYS